MVVVMAPISLVILFYRLAEMEDLPVPFAWGGISFFIYMGVGYGLKWGMLGGIIAQLPLALLLVGWTIYNKRQYHL